MNLQNLANQLIDLKKNIVLVFAFNCTGKTRLSVEYKSITKQKNKGNHSGVYYNAYSEDLFNWDNDVENEGGSIKLDVIPSSLNQFHSSINEDKVREKLSIYKPKFDFDFNYFKDTSKGIESIQFYLKTEKKETVQDYIKISRGEQQIFIWCFFLTLFDVQGWTGQQNSHFFIDDPVSSLDDHNIFITASTLMNLIDDHYKERKIIITTHHVGFFSILADWLKKGEKATPYKKELQMYILKNSVNALELLGCDKDVFLYHLELLQLLQYAVNDKKLYAYHFAILRQVLENISSFLGVGRISYVLEQIGISDTDEIARIVNTLSHKTVFRYEARRIADQLRGAMNADDFRDYMLSFLFLRYLSDHYEAAAKKELGKDYPNLENGDRRTPLSVWYEKNEEDTADFEKQMRRKVHYVIKPQYLWSSIYELARTQNGALLKTLHNGFKHVENDSFESTFQGLFSEINLDSEKLGKNHSARNAKLCTIVTKIAEGLSKFSTESDILGDAYEYLIGQFAAGSGKKAGEFYTPQQISTILSRIVTLDSQNPASGKKKKLKKVLDFACGSGSLLLNVRKQLGQNSIGQIYGQEKNITTYNLARMNMLLHGLKDSEFQIHHGDSLVNDWDILNEMNPAKKLECDAVIANPPFSYRWEPTESMADDFRFKGYGLAPKSAADFAFLLHGFHFLSDEGTMAIILPHGVLFRGGAEERIRTKLLNDGNIDTVIGLPANLFYSTGIPVCILVLKKCKKPDDVLFINASEYSEPGKRQNILLPEHIDKIVDTYQYRKEKEQYSRCVSMEEIKKNEFNLNISRYISNAEPEPIIDIKQVNKDLAEIEKILIKAKKTHNSFLKELALKELP